MGGLTTKARRHKMQREERETGREGGKERGRWGEGELELYLFNIDLGLRALVVKTISTSDRRREFQEPSATAR
jgi:hypothetical protein